MPHLRIDSARSNLRFKIFYWELLSMLLAIDRRPVVHRAPDSQFREVRRQQEPKGVSLRPQACLWRIHFGDRFNIM